MSTAPVKPGDVIADKFLIERILGAGGMGVVVVARHVHLDQRVAIKFLLPAVAKSPEAVARFAREARAAAKIQSEHVARVLDVATHDGTPYMVMEYLEGQDLESTLQELGTLPIDKAIDYVLQALEALAEAHVAGIVHRDLKPANIFLARRADGSSIVKILDFGISKLSGGSDPQITTTSAQMGSPLYMSPEQLRRTKDVDARADIWSLGVILQELIVGEAPFMSETLPEIIAMILSEPPLSMRLRRPDVPSQLEAVIRRCLEKRPGDRYPNVAALAVALQPFAPERSRVSIDRVTRVIAGRTQTSVNPSPDQEARASVQPKPIHHAPTVATDSSWHTSGVLRAARSGRRLVVLAVAGLVAGGAIAAAFVVTRGSPSATASVPTPDATSASALPATSAPLAATTEPAAPAPSMAPAAPSQAPRSTPRPTAAVVASHTTTSAVAAPVPTPSPASTKPGPSDFGGRK